MPDLDHDPAFVYPSIYMYVTTALVAVNVFYGVGAFSMEARIRFGYVMFLLSLAAVPVIQHFLLAVSH